MLQWLLLRLSCDTLGEVKVSTHFLIPVLNTRQSLVEKNTGNGSYQALSPYKVAGCCTKSKSSMYSSTTEIGTHTAGYALILGITELRYDTNFGELNAELS